MTAPGRHVIPAQQLLRRTSLPRQMKLEAEVIGSAAKFSVNWQRQFLTKYGEPFAIEPSKQEKDRLWPNRQSRSLFPAVFG